MNRLSLRNNQLKLETSGELPNILEESIEENTSNEWKQNRKMSTCNRLDLESLGSWPIVPKNFLGSILNRSTYLVLGKVFFWAPDRLTDEEHDAHQWKPGGFYKKPNTHVKVIQGHLLSVPVPVITCLPYHFIIPWLPLPVVGQWALRSALLLLLTSPHDDNNPGQRPPLDGDLNGGITPVKAFGLFPSAQPLTWNNCNTTSARYYCYL